MKFTSKLGLSFGVGFALSVAFLLWVRATSGNLPYPVKGVWDWAFFAGVIVSQNVHRPSLTGIVAFLVLSFSGISFVLLSAIAFGFHLLERIKQKAPPSIDS